jgi:glucose/arabinose dehydrogenase
MTARRNHVPMQSHRRCAAHWSAVAVILLSLGAAHAAPATVCPENNTGITLSPGFCASIFAENIGHARHLVVSPSGVVYVNTWSGTYYNADPIPAGGFLLALKDSQSKGKADVVKRFGESAAQGAAGGTGIALYQGAIYAEVNDRIMRYALATNEIVPSGKGEVVVSGLPITGDHPMHPFIIDAKGNLFVDLGTATNACEEKNRVPNSPGRQPCTEKETRGGTWRYDANRTDQGFSAAERYASGIRNGEGFAIDADGRLFVTQHGRDQLAEDWQQFYKGQLGSNLPAEEIVRLEQGHDYGWPECYFDGFQEKLVLAPEYGGDGGKKVGVCATRTPPVAFFPAHWAPNDLLIASNSALPAVYRNGAFVAFHGSWNRAGAAGGVQRGVSTDERWQGIRQIHHLRGRICRRCQRTGSGCFSTLGTRARPRRRHLYLGRLARKNLARDLSGWAECSARLGAGISGSGCVLLGSPSTRRCASRRRTRGRCLAADSARRNPSGSGARVPDLPRSGQERNVRWMPRFRRQRQPRRRRPHGEHVAVERWKS